MTADEMVGWDHQLNAHEFEQALGDSDGQGSLACWSSWGGRVGPKTEQLNNSKPFTGASLVAQMVKKLPAMRGHFIGIY